MDPRIEGVLEKATQEIVGTAGTKLRLLVLYGSEARGEATPESDIDLLAITEAHDPGLARQLRDALYNVMWEHDFARLISLHIMPFGEFESQKREGYSFVQNVEEEGRVLWPAA